MITPELKDQVIEKLLDQNTVDLCFDGNELANNLNITFNALDVIIKSFEEKRFLKADRLLGGGYMLQLYPDIYEFKSRGGFTMEELIYQQQIQKLVLELENLKDKLPKGIELSSNIGNIMNTFMSILKYST